MRALFVALTLSLLALPLTASAKCASYAETLLTPEVPAGTPLLLFELYSFDDELPADLTAVARQFELVSATGAKVPLTARATHAGMNQTQIELVPTKPLVPGSYRLVRATRPDGRERQTHTLKVVAQVRHAPTGPLAAPKVVASQSIYEEFGCGPGESIDVTLAATSPYHADASQEARRYAFVTLAQLGGTYQRGFVAVAPTTDGGLGMSVGHGMCSGEFMATSGQSYITTIQLVGPDGTLGAATTTSFTYTGGR